MTASSTPTEPHPILLYDGVCALCNRLVQFVLKRDRRDRFCFASLQSDFAATILARHGINPQSLDTVYLVQDPGQPDERLLARNEAVREVLNALGPFSRLWAAFLGLLPQTLRDWQYNLVARNRYRLFGKYETCPLPQPADRHKFLG